MSTVETYQKESREVLDDLVVRISAIPISCPKEQFFRDFFDNFGHLIPKGYDEILALFIRTHVAPRYHMSDRSVSLFEAAVIEFYHDFGQVPSHGVDFNSLWTDILGECGFIHQD